MTTRVFAASGAKNPKKQNYFDKLIELCETYPQILIVEADNVGSRQMAEVRFALRGRATMLMGKNTMIRTCLRRKVQEMPQLQALIDLVQANVGLVFCEESPAAIRKTILEHKVPAPAKQGAIAPCDVVIPAGPTGMDPGQTSFFQALGIATKIVKSQIEIQADVHIIKTGDRVSASQAVLLERLNIRPFAYGLKCPTVYDNGDVYPATVLDISTDDVTAAIKSAISAATALSLGASIPTVPAIPHLIVSAFRKACGVAMACEFEIPELETLKAAAAAAPAAAAAAPAASDKKEEAPKEAEKEESEDEDMGFSLFD